jgi:hypothetical protein
MHTSIDVNFFKEAKKMLKKQKLGLLSFHEENTGGIQTQATKIL